MSASAVKADIPPYAPQCPLMTQSGHRTADRGRDLARILLLERRQSAYLGSGADRVFDPRRKGHLVGAIQKACSTLKPPMNMRFPSTGMVLPMSLNDCSSIIAFMTRSRSSRDLYTTHDNITISSSASCTAWGNDVCLPGFTSSAMQSTYSMAPCFLTKSLMFFEKVLYS